MTGLPTSPEVPPRRVAKTIRCLKLNDGKRLVIPNNALLGVNEITNVKRFEVLFCSVFVTLPNQCQPL